MAFARRNMRFRRRTSVIRKRQGAWTGIAIQSMTLTQGVTSSLYLWSDIDSAKLNLAGKGVHQRTLLWIGFSPGSISYPYHIAWTLNLYQTDAANNTPTSSIIAPLDDAAALFERSPLEWGYRFTQPNSGTGSFTGTADGLTITRDIKVKRKLDDTDALMLSFQYRPMAPFTGTTTMISVYARTYVSW